MGSLLARQEAQDRGCLVQHPGAQPRVADQGEHVAELRLHVRHLVDDSQLERPNRALGNLAHPQVERRSGSLQGRQEVAKIRLKQPGRYQRAEQHLRAGPRGAIEVGQPLLCGAHSAHPGVRPGSGCRSCTSIS